MMQTTEHKKLVNTVREILLKYGIMDINEVVEIQQRPSRFVKQDDITRRYQICGVVVRPWETVNTDTGH